MQSTPLGFGLGLRPVHYPELLQCAQLPIDWFEIISENFMGIGGQPRSVLERLRTRYPIACHGVGLSIAGSDPLHPAYLKALKELVDWLEPVLVTDHLCWTSAHGHHTYDLLPFPLTQRSLEHIAARIHAVQEFLGRSMLFENPSCYIDFRSSTWSEADFLAELCRRTDCGLLLDLNNCMVNSRNLAWQPGEYLQRLAPEMVHQFHLAGHSVYDHISIDTHDHPVPEAVWTFYEQASRRFPDAAVLIEWDDKVPPLHRLLEELTTARERHQRGRLEPAAHDTRSSPPALDSAEDWRDEQQQLIQYIVAPQPVDPPDDLWRTTPVAAPVGLKVYRDGYFLRARDTLKDCFPALASILGAGLFERVVQDFLIDSPPEHYSINYLGQELPSFLARQQLPYEFGADQDAIAELAAVDWAEYELKIRADDPTPPLMVSDLIGWQPDDWAERRLYLRQEISLLALQWSLFDAWQEIRAGAIPPPPTPGREWVVWERSGTLVQSRKISETLFQQYQKLQQGAELSELLGDDPAVQEQLEPLMLSLLQLAEKGLLQARTR